MEKNSVSIISFLIFILVYIATILLLPFLHNIVFWCAFVISIFEYCIISIVMIMAINTKSSKEKVYELAKCRYSVAMLCVCTLINLFTMIYEKMPIWGIVISNMISISIYIVVIIFYSELKKENSILDKELYEKTREFKAYSIKIEQSSLKAHNLELRESINDILETLKYSDPIMPEQAYELNHNIDQCINTLEELIDLKKETEAIECCKKLLELLHDRNRLCKLYK